MNKIISILIFTCLFTDDFVIAQPYPKFNVTAYDSSKSEGYYFFCPYKFSAFQLSFPPGTQHQMILDKKGEVIYYRDSPGYFSGDFKVQRNALMSYCGDGKFYLMDSTFTIVDSVTTGNGITFDIHDLQVLQNGHYLLLGLENVTMDLSSYHIFKNNGTPGSANANVTAFVVQELDSAKNIVFEWHAKDHFNFDDVDSFWLTDTSNVDWTHANAVEMDVDGNILVSSRHFAEITKINRSDSSIIWRLGGNKNDFTFIGDSLKFLSQHDCRMLPNGNLTLFDNGRATNPVHFASAKEYKLDEVNHTATLVWSHNEGPGIWSRSQGDVQRLPNGNTLTSYGNLNLRPVVFNVVDSLQNKVFEIVFPDSLLSYRSFNYSSLPWEFHRPLITCKVIDSHYFLSADSGYSHYNWSTGDTTQNIPVTDTGNFSVFVPIGNGGFISSEKFAVSDTSDPCGIRSVKPIEYTNEVLLYPNPATDQLTIYSPGKSSIEFEIIDITGRKLLIGKTNSTSKTEIDISSLSSGIYSIRIDAGSKKFIKN